MEEKEKTMRYNVDHLIYAADDTLWNTVRIGITLTEPIDAAALRAAADRLPLRFPYFAVRLVQDGDSLFYEPNDAPFVISEDGKCVALASEESNHHLMAFAYKGNTIYNDISHFLMDGGGNFPVVIMLLYEYLHQVHPEEEFDLSKIPQPGDKISQEELTDHPYPTEPIPVNPLGGRRRPEKVFKLDDMPQGYDNIGDWTSFRMKILKSEMMDYISSADGSPATFISSLIYRAISDLHPENQLPLVCGMQHQFRKALGNLRSHSSHVRIVPIVYPNSYRNRDLDSINTLGRGSLIINADIEHDKLVVNEHIKNANRIKGLTLLEKRELMKKIVLDGIGENTFGVSYVGLISFCGMEKYIQSFIPHIDMTLSGGMSAEIFFTGKYFDINIMQRNSDDKYIKRIRELLAEKGIHCLMDEPEHFEICRF